MHAISQSFASAGVLALGCLLGIGASPVQAQNGTYPSRGPSYPFRVRAVRGNVYSKSAGASVTPAPTFTQRTRNGSFSYYDRDGVEHDSRYPHWSYDSRMTVR